MEIERFTQFAKDPRRTKPDLQNMLANALNEGKTEFASIAKYELDIRFPGWDCVRSKKGGTSPTVVVFADVEHRFPTAKEAYLWLVERFIQAYPQPFLATDGEIMLLAKGKSRDYFSRDLKKMFHRHILPMIRTTTRSYLMDGMPILISTIMKNSKFFASSLI